MATGPEAPFLDDLNKKDMFSVWCAVAEGGRLHAASRRDAETRSDEIAVRAHPVSSCRAYNVARPVLVVVSCVLDNEPRSGEDGAMIVAGWRCSFVQAG